MSVREVVKALFPINCRYNYKVEKDGKCHSLTCMLSQVNIETSNKIKEFGCKVYIKIINGEELKYEEQ